MKCNMNPFNGLILFVFFISVVGCAPHSASHRGENGPVGLYEYNPKAASVNVQLGLAYLKQGETQRAKRKLLLASKQDEASARVQNALAYYYEETGESTLAEQHYLAAIHLEQGSGDLHNNYGVFLCGQKRFEAARNEFMKAVADKKYLHTAEAYENIGLCAMDNHRYQDGCYFLQKALKKDPKLSKARIELERMKKMGKQHHG